MFYYFTLKIITNKLGINCRLNLFVFILQPKTFSSLIEPNGISVCINRWEKYEVICNAYVTLDLWLYWHNNKEAYCSFRNQL